MKNLWMIIIAMFFVSACGQGFEQKIDNGTFNSGLNCMDGCDDGDKGDDSGDGGTDNLPTLPDLKLDGKVSGGIWDGKELLKLDKKDKSILIRIPMDFNTEIVEGSFPLSGNEDIVLEFVQDGNDETFLQLRVPIERMIGKIELPEKMGLPNGDPLPKIKGGKLYHKETKIGGSKAHIYTGKATLAMFVPTKFNPYVNLVFPIKNKREVNLGYFATVAEKNDHRGGFFVSITLPQEVQDLLDTWLP